MRHVSRYAEFGLIIACENGGFTGLPGQFPDQPWNQKARQPRHKCPNQRCRRLVADIKMMGACNGIKRVQVV